MASGRGPTCRKGSRIFVENDTASGIARGLGMAAIVQASMGDPELAARIAGTTYELVREKSVMLAPVKVLHLPEPADLVREALGEERANELMAEGAAIPVSDMVAIVVAAPPPHGAGPQPMVARESSTMSARTGRRATTGCSTGLSRPHRSPRRTLVPLEARDPRRQSRRGGTAPTVWARCSGCRPRPSTGSLRGAASAGCGMPTASLRPPSAMRRAIRAPSLHQDHKKLGRIPDGGG